MCIVLNEKQNLSLPKKKYLAKCLNIYVSLYWKKLLFAQVQHKTLRIRIIFFICFANTHFILFLTTESSIEYEHILKKKSAVTSSKILRYATFPSGLYTMETLSNPYRVHQCLKCQGDTEYYCESCPGCFCSPCD